MAASFSYAQAARGLAAPTTGSTPSAKSPSEQSPNLTPKTADAPADESQSPSAEVVQAATAQSPQHSPEAQSTAVSHDNKTSSPLLNGVSPPDSPDYGVSSTSTLVKDDDQSSAIHTSSESTWENKSQASAVVDATNGEPGERSSEKAKSKGKDQPKESEEEAPPAKPLHEAPPPVVNIWKQRAEQRAAAPSPVKATAPIKREAASANKSHSMPEASLASAAAKLAAPKERNPESASSRNQSQTRATGSKSEETARGRRAQVPRAASHEITSSASKPQPPPRDQEYWPTPDTAIEEDRKKSVEKVEKSDNKEKAEDESVEKKKAHGKSAWTHVPFTPTVVFSTPLPGTGRRGGRGGGRGGREETSRRAGNANQNAVNATAPADENKSTSPSLPNGDNSRRGRPEPATRSTSPSKGKTGQVQPGAVAATAPQVASAEVDVTKPDVVNGEVGGLANGHPRRYSTDRAANSNGPSIRGSGTRARGRRGDFGASADRRRDTDGASVTGEQASVAGQKPTPLDASERRKKSISEEVLSPSKQQSSDRRNSAFGTYPNARERGEPRPRGGTRGRGGSHHFQPSQQFTNGQFGPNSGSTVPQPYGYPASNSPPGWPQGQSGPYFAPPPPQHTRSFRGGSQRAQSIPTDLGYGQYGAPYAASHMLPIQTQFGYPFDPQGAAHSMSASAYGPYPEQFGLYSMVATQLEYYFSVDNLIKDVYLRRHMDSQGFVNLSVIANFSRMKKLTTDLDLIKYACAQSRTVEWRVTGEGKDYLRPVGDWQQWVMPVEERDSSARNDGPSELFMPGTPVPQGFDSYGLQMRHSLGGPIHHSAAPSTGPWQQANGGRLSQGQSPMSPPEPTYGQMYPTQQPMQNGYDGREQYAPRTFSAGGLNHATDPEADTFSDVAATKLMVVVGNSNDQQAATPLSTESAGPNGVTDEKPAADGNEAMTKSESVALANGDDSHRGRTGHLSHASSASHGSAHSLDGSKICWTKSDDCTSNMIPGREQTERYPVLREQALRERAEAPEGVCPHNLIVLYKFWSHFLLRNFNTNMYNEFRHLALQDYHERQTDVGYHNLLKYYQQALASTDRPIRDRVAKHYVQLAQAEQQNDNDHEQVAFKQLRGQWQHTDLDQLNREKLSTYLNPELKSMLES